MATVHFPSGWTQYTSGLDAVVVDATRVDDLMRALTARFPALAHHLEQVAVAIDGRIYHHARYENYEKLEPHSEVHLLPPVAGG